MGVSPAPAVAFSSLSFLLCGEPQGGWRIFTPFESVKVPGASGIWARQTFVRAAASAATARAVANKRKLPVERISLRPSPDVARLSVARRPAVMPFRLRFDAGALDEYQFTAEPSGDRERH